MGLLLLCMRLRASLVMVAAFAALSLFFPSSATGQELPLGSQVGIPAVSLPLLMPIDQELGEETPNRCSGKLPSFPTGENGFCGADIEPEGSIETLWLYYCNASTWWCGETNGVFEGRMGGTLNNDPTNFISPHFDIKNGVYTGQGCYYFPGYDDDPNWFSAASVELIHQALPTCGAAGGFGLFAEHFTDPDP